MRGRVGEVTGPLSASRFLMNINGFLRRKEKDVEFTLGNQVRGVPSPRECERQGAKAGALTTSPSAEQCMASQGPFILFSFITFLGER